MISQRHRPASREYEAGKWSVRAHLQVPQIVELLKRLDLMRGFKKLSLLEVVFWQITESFWPFGLDLRIEHDLPENLLFLDDMRENFSLLHEDKEISSVPSISEEGTYVDYRACVSMGAKGAWYPRNFWTVMSDFVNFTT